MGHLHLDAGLDIKGTFDNGFILAGKTHSNNGDVAGNHSTSNPDYWVVKIDSSGLIEWQKCLGSIYNEQSTSIEQTTDSGYIVTGITSASVNNGDVIKSISWPLQESLPDCHSI